MTDAGTTTEDSADSTAVATSPKGDSSRNATNQMEQRRSELKQLEADGGGRLEYRFDVDHSASDIASTWADIPRGMRTNERVHAAGRLVLDRHHGGLTFGV